MTTSQKEVIIQVEPIRTEKEMKEMKLAIKRGIKAKPRREGLAKREVFLFTFGINTGLTSSN